MLRFLEEGVKIMYVEDYVLFVLKHDKKRKQKKA